jgi:hypothetical protein
MSVFTLSVQPQLVDTTDLVIDDVASIEVVELLETAVYSNLDDALDFRKAEIFRAWDMCYKGWKQNAYDPFDGSAPGVPHYLMVPLNAPYPAHRLITTDLGLLVDGYVGFGVGGEFTATNTAEQKTLLVRTAFDQLRDYFLEKVK